MSGGNVKGKNHLPKPKTCFKVLAPVGQAGRKAVFCDKPVVPGTVYCKEHQTK